MKSLSPLDLLIIEIEHSLRTTLVKPPTGSRPYPASTLEPTTLEDNQASQVAGLMRVNNAGEVAAQGLYRGQAVSARDEKTRTSMLQAAQEENEHLNWCQTRLQELGANRSLLDPFWYWGSFGIGLSAGAIGDKWSLGFVEETEKQVTEHLQEHLSRLPQEDHRSAAIIEQMKQDEMKHAEYAHEAGAATLPPPIQKAMTLVSKIMTFSAYRI